MKGTPKQIKYAEDIVNKARKTIEDKIRWYEKRNKEVATKQGIEHFFEIDIQVYKELGEMLENTVSRLDAPEIIKRRMRFDHDHIVEVATLETDRRRTSKK